MWRSSDGTVSAREFHASAHALAERWKRTNTDLPPWTWVSSATQLGDHLLRSSDQTNGFLTLEKLCFSELTHKDMSSRNSNSERLDEVTQAEKEETTSLSQEIEPLDNATMVEIENGPGGVEQLLYYDFHIVYSPSYRVPILFFRAYRIDGESLSLEEIAKELPSSSAKMLVESKWTFITQEEHPYLKRPWYKLHPCGTREWIKLLIQSDSSSLANTTQDLYLLSWLSVVGPLFGLRIPYQIINLCN